MVSKAEINKNLKELDNLYNKSKSSKHKNYYSKLAIIELGGWIEDAMDKIITNYSDIYMSEADYKTFLKKEIIEKNWGFKYQENFRWLLINLIGIVQFEKLEPSLDGSKLSTLKHELTTFKKIRNDLAHTYVSKGMLFTIDAPSVTLNRVEPVYKGLRDIESKLKKI